MNENIGKYPDHYSHSMGLPRVNITPIVRDVSQHGFKKPENDILNPNPKLKLLGLIGKETFKPTPEEAIEIYHLGKPERYALTAVIIDGVINHALANRHKFEPLGLIGYPIDSFTLEENTTGQIRPVNYSGTIEPLRWLDINMLRTLDLAYNEYMDFMGNYSKKNPNDPNSQAYLRLKQWEKFYHKFLPLTPNGEIDLGQDVNLTMNRVFTEAAVGIKTAVRLMSSLLRLAPQVLERDLPWQEINPEMLAKAAKNSFPLIAKSAMLPFDVFTEIHLVISDERIGINEQRPDDYFLGRLNPANFIIKETGDGYRIDFDESLQTQIQYYMAQSKETGQKFTVGCPAMVDIDRSGSAIRKLWDWHLDIATEFYHDLWPYWFKPKAAREARAQAIRDWAKKEGLMVAGIDF